MDFHSDPLSPLIPLSHISDSLSHISDSLSHISDSLSLHMSVSLSHISDSLSPISDSLSQISDSLSPLIPLSHSLSHSPTLTLLGSASPSLLLPLSPSSPCIPTPNLNPST